MVYNILSDIISLAQCKNNKKIYTSKECPLCNYISKKSKIFRYNTKLKVGKSYCCGFSFKSKDELITRLNEHKRYNQWLKDKVCMNYSSFEKFRLAKLENDPNLPF
jgi:hypothetical protein